MKPDLFICLLPLHSMNVLCSPGFPCSSMPHVSVFISATASACLPSSISWRMRSAPLSMRAVMISWLATIARPVSPRWAASSRCCQCGVVTAFRRSPLHQWTKGCGGWGPVHVVRQDKIEIMEFDTRSFHKNRAKEQLLACCHHL